MSVNNSSPTGIEESCAEDHSDDANKETSFPGASSPDRSAIQRVLKEVGLTSTTFIGPEFPPNKPEDKLDHTLDEFYREIETIDLSDAAKHNSGETVDFVLPHSSPVTTSANCTDRNKGDKDAKPFHYQQSSGERPHRYKKEPYFHRRPRESVNFMHSAASNQRQWHHSQTVNRPRSLNLIHPRPPLHHPPAFPYPHFSTQNLPPPNVSCHSSEGPVSGSLQGHSFFTHLEDNVNFGLSRDRSQQFEGDYRPHSQNPDNSLWKHHRQMPSDFIEYPSTMVLILMRGLPGSGKSTLAR